MATSNWSFPNTTRMVQQIKRLDNTNDLESIYNVVASMLAERGVGVGLDAADLRKMPTKDLVVLLGKVANELERRVK